jgi:hypothetical protein
MKKILIKYKSKIIRAFVELLVIFVGISASFLVDEWRQNNADDELELHYMKALYEDLTEDLANLETQINRRNVTLDRCHFLLDAMHFPDSVQISDAQFKHYFKSMSFLEKFVPADNTFRDLNSTGNMKLIDDPELKNNIYDYYRSVEELAEIESINNAASADLTLKVVTENFSVRTVYGFDEIYDNLDELIQFDTTVFRNPNSIEYKEMENLLLFRNIFLSVELNHYNSMWEPAHELHDRLHAYIYQ